MIISSQEGLEAQDISTSRNKNEINNNAACAQKHSLVNNWSINMTRKTESKKQLLYIHKDIMTCPRPQVSKWDRDPQVDPKYQKKNKKINTAIYKFSMGCLLKIYEDRCQPCGYPHE